jgi:hypothetical protein
VQPLADAEAYWVHCSCHLVNLAWRAEGSVQVKMEDAVHCSNWVVLDPWAESHGLRHEPGSADGDGASYLASASQADYYLADRGDYDLAGWAIVAWDSPSCRLVQTHSADLHCAETKYSKVLFSAKC